MGFDFQPTATIEALQHRSKLINDLRAFFVEQGFWEVETPLLSSDTVVDRFIEPIRVTCNQQPMWLQSSPEFCMKRLLAAGSGSIFQICKAFRQDEKGPLHNPEFTILEWYQVNADYSQGMTFLQNVAKRFLSIDRVDRISYRQAFENHLGIHPLVASISDLQQVAKTHELEIPLSLTSDRDEWLHFLLATLIEPNLGIEAPVILYDYPASQNALARLAPQNNQFAERFELYDRGIELANGYHELLDADELRHRNAETNAKRIRDGACRLPDDSRLLAAMESGLPSCAGVALGVDRLAMMTLDETNIRKVIAFPVDLA